MDTQPKIGHPGSQWFTVFRPVARPRLRLFCLPYAGAGASAFRDWPRLLPTDVELCAVQLPGRENRIREPVPARIDELLPSLVAAIRPLVDGPFVLFGHSLGAAISYELARGLKAIGRPPSLLCVSGRRAPHVPRGHPPLHGLADVDLKRRIAEMGGTPPEVLAHEELMDFLLPTIRADLRLAETYQRAADRRLTCPIVAFAGSRDPEAPPSEVETWSDVAGGPFVFHVLDGDHFFPRPHLGRVTATILEAAEATLGGTNAQRIDPGTFSGE